MISACGPLDALAIKSSGFWHRSLAALKKHSQSLEALWLRRCNNLRSWMCQWILVSYPKLRSFKTDRVFAHELVTGPKAEKARSNQKAQDARDDIATRQQEITDGEHEMVDELNAAISRFAASRDIQRVEPWVCLSLRYLSINIEFPSGPETAGWDPHVFRQISKLGCLMGLNLTRYGVSRNALLDGNSGTRGLQLKVGCGMALLETVENISSLEFVGTGQHMDKEDLLWILDQWPPMCILSRDFHEDIEVRRSLWQSAISISDYLPNTYGIYDYDDDYCDEEIEEEEDDGDVDFPGVI